MTGLRLNSIYKKFGDKPALRGVSFAVAQGEIVALLGPSGCGKSTLLAIIAGLEMPDGGEIYWDEEDLQNTSPHKRGFGLMFQDYALFPHMSVGANVGFGLLMRKVPKAQRAARVKDALDMVGLSGMSTRRVHQLSGGQQQRVALARALVVEPTVLLLDEPLGALDLNLRRQMQQELIQIQKQVGTTFVHVTHDQEEAMSIADVIAVMNNGHIEDLGPPERVYMKPRSLFTATFMGESNIIEGHVVNRNGNRIDVEKICCRFPLGNQILDAADIHVGKPANAR